MNKKMVLVTLMSIIPVLVFAGTSFELEKKTTDPFVADRGGFRSLFVNPAGAAGQSDFQVIVEGGARTTLNDVRTLMALGSLGSTALNGGTDLSSYEIANAGETVSELYAQGVIDDSALTALFEGSSLDPTMGLVNWNDPESIEDYVLADNLTDSEIASITSNIDDIVNGTDPARATAFYSGLPERIETTVMASAKAGFLLGGFGLGVYDNALGVGYLDAVDQEFGVDTVYNELGVIAGGGFHLMEGRLALGVSANYSILSRNTNPIPYTEADQLFAGDINFGYSWGVDVGAIFRPTPSWGIGLVFNDVVGYTETELPHYAANGYEELWQARKYLIEDSTYRFQLDMDAGVSFQPDWRFFRPKLSLDLYDVIGYGRAVKENGDDFAGAMHRSLEHIRIGASVSLFDFLNIGAQYQNRYMSLGAGLDLFILEIYGEVKVHDSAFSTELAGDMPVGADVMVRFHL